MEEMSDYIRRQKIMNNLTDSLNELQQERTDIINGIIKIERQREMLEEMLRRNDKISERHTKYLDKLIKEDSENDS